MQEEKIELEKHRTRGIVIQVIFILAIIFASYAMIYTTKALIENSDLIGREPLQYAVEVYNFTSCTCYGESGDPMRYPSFSDVEVIDSGSG